MKTIRTTITVDNEHRATIHLPDDVAPGTHAVVLVIHDAAPRPRPTMEGFPQHDVELNLPEGYKFRRKQMYDGDRGP